MRFNQKIFITILSAIILAYLLLLTIFRGPRIPNQGDLIIITGTSSTGKSSTAHALQKIFEENNVPYLNMGTDKFLTMLPKKWVNFDLST